MTARIEEIVSKLTTEEIDLVKCKFGIDLRESEVIVPQDAQLVWDEYAYRHEHIWSTIYKLTYIVAILGALPYLNEDLAFELGYAAMIPSALGSLLSFLGSMMIFREMQVFEPVKIRHRNIHSGIRSDPAGRRLFKGAVVSYLLGLTGASIWNATVLYHWLW